MKILVVEDERTLAQVLGDGLREAGFLVDLCYDGRSALEQARLQAYDAIVLDQMLPGLDGLSVCRALRDHRLNTPILFLTARDTLEDKVTGFNVGGDDYLTKPFDFPELLARLRSLVRRAHQAPSHMLQVGDLQLDTLAHEVYRGGDRVSLSPREYSLLQYLLWNAGRVVPREQILNSVWPTDYTGGSNVVEVYIRYLRRKLDDGREVRLIHTVPGAGYVVREPE